MALDSPTPGFDPLIIPRAETNQSDVVIPAEVIAETIASFTSLDASGDRRSMNKMARRLGKEQPALLQFAANQKLAAPAAGSSDRPSPGGTTKHSTDDVGEAAVFYGTLVWAIFDRHRKGSLPRLTGDNLAAADTIVKDELSGVEGLADRPIHERFAPGLAERQPHLFAKLRELVEEDVREAAMTGPCAEVVYPATQVVLEAFDAALTGRRPGERIGPVVRDKPKVGRNEPCPCGSGQKYKKCCEGKA